MAHRGITARAIARSAGLTVVRVPDLGTVRQDGPVLEIGLGASDHEIASVGYRRLLAMIGVRDERRVRRYVERSGYRYVRENVDRQIAN